MILDALNDTTAIMAQRYERVLGAAGGKADLRVERNSGVARPAIAGCREDRISSEVTEDALRQKS